MRFAPSPALPEAVLPWTSVVRRDGTTAPFDAARIRSAIARAGAASGEFSGPVAAAITQDVLDALRARFPDRPPPIEDIQDAVELALMRAGHLRTARAYIIYRAQHTRLRHDRGAVVDAVASINEYLERQDWRVKANANQGYSLGGLILNSVGQAGRQLLAEQRLSRGDRHARIARATSISTTSTCWPAIAPAGRCAPC